MASLRVSPTSPPFTLPQQSSPLHLDKIIPYARAIHAYGIHGPVNDDGYMIATAVQERASEYFRRQFPRSESYRSLYYTVPTGQWGIVRRAYSSPDFTPPDKRTSRKYAHPNRHPHSTNARPDSLRSFRRLLPPNLPPPPPQPPHLT